MKRAAVLTLLVVATIIGFLTIRGTMPFMPVFGNSMEPVLKAGNLILIDEALPSEIQEGDIVVFTIPPLVREHYNYPPIIAHRVIEVRTMEGYGTVFRTKGDNTGEDPFTVRPQDLKGKVSKQISYLGFPLLFFQSQQGLMFIIIFLCLLTFYLYGDEINLGRRKVQEGVFAPVIRDNRRRGRLLEQRTERMETGVSATQHALEQFAGAIAEYAQHLKSHTSAIQGLSEASHELKNGAAEQNRVLTHLVEIMAQKPLAGVQPTPETEEAVPEQEILEREKTAPQAEKGKFPPGCVRSRQRHTDQDNILDAG